MMKKFNKQNGGITLIALVITIIVLLILASVSIAMLTGNNGILIQTKVAKENTQAAKGNEENKLASNNNYINEQLGNAVPGEIVSETKKDNYVDSNGDKATVPAGFTVSKIAEEQKVSEGLVIYDIPKSEIENVDWTTKNADGAYNVQTLYNQFVWIPVASAEKYQRDFSYPGSFSSSEENLFTDTGYLPLEIQPQNDESDNNETAEKEAVLKYNGFYVTRYEIGNVNNTVVSKQRASVYCGKSQEEFKMLEKMMYGSGSIYVKSAMCSGIQWDIIMKFVDGKKDATKSIYDIRNINSNRHIGIPELSGKNLADKVQNIYDLEGNRYEYVAERNNIEEYTFINRGGGYDNYDNYKASRRSKSRGKADSGETSRIVLYIM